MQASVNQLSTRLPRPEGSFFVRLRAPFLSFVLHASVIALILLQRQPPPPPTAPISIRLVLEQSKTAAFQPSPPPPEVPKTEPSPAPMPSVRGPLASDGFGNTERMDQT